MPIAWIPLILPGTVPAPETGNMSDYNNCTTSNETGDFTVSSLPELVMPEHAVDLASATNGPKRIDFVQIALNNWKLIAFGSFLGLLLGIAAYLFSGPDYKASTKVLVQRNKSNHTVNAQRDVVVHSDRAGHIAIIKSPLILNDAIKVGKLDELSTSKGATDLVTDLAEGVMVTRTAGGEVSLINVLEISVTNKKAKEAVIIVDAVAQAYKRWLLKEHSKHNEQIVADVLKAERILAENLQAKEDAYATFIEESPHTWQGGTHNGKPGARTNVHQVKIEDILKRINDVNHQSMEIQSRKTKLAVAQNEGKSDTEIEKMIQRFNQMEQISASRSRGSGGSGGGSGASDQTSPTQMLIPLLLKQKELLTEFGANHPDLREVRVKIAELRTILSGQGVALPAQGPDGSTEVSNLNVIQIYLSSLQVREELLEEQLELLNIGLEAEVLAAKKLTRTAMEADTFASDISNTKQILDKVTLRLNELGLNNGAGYTMEVMNKGRHQLNIKKPIKFVVASMVLMAGAVMALLCLREFKDMTVRTADDLRVRLGLPVIGGVPFYVPSGREELAASSFPNLHPALCYAHKPGSLEAEAIRSVRTSVIVQAESVKAKVIQITSAEPGDGKSTLVANLAIAMAQSGKRVLLVEADMRRPVLGGLFGVKPEIGLSDVLKGDVHFRNIIQQSVFEGLSVALAGGKAGAPAELLASSVLPSALDDVREDYDLILIDSPPLLAVADPCIIGRSTDGVLMVVRLGKNQYAYISRAQELLATHSIKLLGVIANGIFDLSDGSGYGYGYGYGDEPADNAKVKLPGTIGKILEPYVSA